MKKLITTLTLVTIVNPVFADNCSTYPVTDGLAVEMTEAGAKYLSTATATVAFDDTDEVLDALKEAELYAKANISKFLSETIQSDESLDKAVNTTVKIVGGSKVASKETVKKLLTSIRNSSQSLLKGVLKLGDCYTQGQYVRVTVGLKPEMTAAAAMTEVSINRADDVSTASEVSSTTSNAGNSSTSTSNLNKTQGFSNTSKLSDF